MVVASTIVDAPFSTHKLHTQRLEAALDDHFDLVWRTLRRLGVATADVDDAAQEVFVVLARRLTDVEPHSERAFLIATAARVASTRRRSVRRRQEDVRPSLDDLSAAMLGPEELNELKSARALLDQALARLSADLRMTFVLYELEELSVAEIADALGIPKGTVTWRLKAAREAFEQAAARLRAREAFPRRVP